MKRLATAALFAAALPLAGGAQESVGSMTVTLGGEEREFVLVQGIEGPTPGSRYSTIGGDVVLTLVAVPGTTPMAPKDTQESLEIRFTAAEGAEVRAGSVLSYSQRDETGVSRTRGTTAGVTLDRLELGEDGIAASGTFSAELPPDQTSDAATIEGTFQTQMQPRETR